MAKAVDVMHALWGPTDPEDVGRGQWWGTPLGRACARHLAHDAAEVLTQAQAAAMLGVPRGTVGSLVHRGQLDRHPDGGVLKSSVLQRHPVREPGARERCWSCWEEVQGSSAGEAGSRRPGVQAVCDVADAVLWVFPY